MQTTVGGDARGSGELDYLSGAEQLPEVFPKRAAHAVFERFRPALALT